MPKSSISTSWTGTSCRRSRSGTVVVASLRPVTDRVLHGHLMVDAPEALLRRARRGRPRHRLVPSSRRSRTRARRSRRRAAPACGVGLTLNLETPGRGRVPAPGRRRRRDADEHHARVVRARRSIPMCIPRLEAVREVDRPGGHTVRAGDRRRGQARQRAARRRRRRHRPGRGVGDLQAPDPAEAARRLAEIARGRPPDGRDRSSSSTTIRISPGSSR